MPVAGSPLGCVVAAFLELRSAQALCEESASFLQDFTNSLRVDGHAWSMDLCPRTWQTCKTVKLHLRVAAVKAERFR